MPPIRLALIGGFQSSATALPLKARALLAYLAVRPGAFHLRDKLAALLWSDVDDARARDSLRQAIASLRRTLPAVDGSVILERDQAFAASPAAIDVDVPRFERLAASDNPADWQAAAECYRGDFLEGVTVNAPVFEEWLVSERERLREVAIETLARLLAFQMHASEPQQAEAAVQTAQRLLALDPLQEAVHRGLMRLYARLGRRSAALRQYQVCVQVLRRELGVDPEADTRRTYETLVQRTIEARAGEPASSSADVLTELPAPLLFGRDKELQRIGRVARDLDRERGHLLLVLGDAGIGKTALLDAVRAALADRRPLVGTGRSHASTQPLPYGPWVEALRGFTLTASAFESLAPVWRAELARLLPELADPTLPPASADTLPLFEAVAQLLALLSRTRPVLVTIEDLHWADETSLRLFGFLGQRIADAPAVLAATARLDEPARPALLDTLLAEWRRERQTVVLRPEPLSPHDVAALTRSRFRAGTSSSHLSSIAEHVWRISRGNPWVATEILQSLGEPGASASLDLLTDGADDVIAARLDRLSDRGKRLVDAAVVIQRPFDFALAPPAAGLSVYEAAEALEEAVRRGVMLAVNDGFDFVHDRVREVASKRIPAGRRRLLHELVGRAIEEVHARDLDQYTSELGLHFEIGGDWMKATDYLRRAGQQAARQSAYKEAVALLTRAVTALERVPASDDRTRLQIDLKIELRSALIPTGDFGAVLSCLREAEALAMEIGDSRRLGRISCHMTQFFWVGGHYPAAIAAGKQALAQGDKLDDLAMRAEAAFFVGASLCSSGQYAQSVDVLNRNVGMLAGPLAVERFGLPFIPAVSSRLFLAWALAEEGRFDEATGRAAEIADIAEAAGDGFGSIEARFAPGFVLVRRGEFGRAIEMLSPAVDACRALHIPLLFPFGACHLGLALAYAGGAPEGVALIEEAIAEADRMHLAANRSRWASMLGEALLAAGRIDDASLPAAEALALARQHEEVGHEAWAHRLLGMVAAARGHGDEAVAHYRACIALAETLTMATLSALARFQETFVPLGAASCGSLHPDLSAAGARLDALGMDGWRVGLLAAGS